MALYEVITFLDENNTVHSFLQPGNMYKCTGGFYSPIQIRIIENNNINLL
jgi:hypothetical protein